MKLAELLKESGINCPKDAAELEITGISYNSINTRPGDVFVCIKGFSTDGHKYAGAAYKKGAVAIIAQDKISGTDIPVLYTEDCRKALSKLSANFYGRPSEDMTIYGVTGTNGKTTISYLIKSVVEASGKQCGVLGTIAYVYGGKTFESVNTTPESFEIQRMLAEMKNDFKTDVCSMEVSSHSLELARVDDVSFDYSAFTNLTEDHLDFHRDFDDYYEAKKRLFLLTKKMNVINTDDEYGEKLYSELEAVGKPVRSYSIDKASAYYRAEIKESSAYGTDAVFFEAGKALGNIHINTPGKFSVANAVCAAGLALSSGISWDEVKAGIEAVRGVAGRFESVPNSRKMSVIVDYAHTPDALIKVLNTAAEFTDGRIITVFGCGGDRDSTKRPFMGEAAGNLSDFCVVTSDNPRTEDPDEIINDILPGINKTGCEYEAVPDRRKAIKRALQEYKPGDTVIIAGKGHETYQIIGDVKQPFDDRETALQIIEQEI